MGIATAAVITCSDRAFAGEVEDESGPAVRDLLLDRGFNCSVPVVVADEINGIRDAIRHAIERGAELIVTTGGTGISSRDVTPEAVNELADKAIPGFGELMRRESLEKIATAALSRAQAVVAAGRLVISVPGNPKGAVENLSSVIDLIPHALELLRGNTSHPSSGKE